MILILIACFLAQVAAIALADRLTLIFNLKRAWFEKVVLPSHLPNYPPLGDDILDLYKKFRIPLMLFTLVVPMNIFDRIFQHYAHRIIDKHMAIVGKVEGSM